VEEVREMAKGAIVLDGKRIEVGQRVEILNGPYASRFAIFRGRSRKQPNKVLVTPFSGNTRILIEAQAIRKVEVRP
jgi:transcription antitermination factor NusG